MARLEYARAYLDHLMILTNGSFKDHCEKLEKVLGSLLSAGPKVNIHKSKFCKEEVEYLVYYITREGIRPLNSKVEAITNIAPPKKRKQLKRFIGMINYYRDMWVHRSHILAPLAALTSVKKKWKWEKNAKKLLKT